MKVVKFKGQRIDNQEWVYGFYVETPNGECRIYYQPFSGATSNTYHIVSRGSVSMFTNMTDAHDNELYDGDNVELFGWGRQATSDGITTIVWDNDITGWNFERSSYAEDRYDFRKAIANCIKVN